ncbi:beta-lactamase-like protein [Lipomyces oligophaga]|uniref:beta-lactamase-like protein n=1 Tax=Lipomyces oligophaga TaxID=45792 RepID=UPI0034CD5C99
MFTFVSLLGDPSSDEEKQQNAVQSVLTFDQQIHVLVDVGWDEHLRPELISDLERIAGTIDLVLLTHATVSHLGAYAYACKYIPGFDSIPTYATLPVINMGRMVTLDAYKTAWFAEGFQGKNVPRVKKEDDISPEQMRLSEVDGIFDKVRAVKYAQQIHFSGKLAQLVVTGHNAGHSLGGTIWRVQHGQEDVVYAIDWNHAVERHLNSSVLLTAPEQVQRPTAMICGARTGVPVKGREDLLVTAIVSAVERGGSVMLPTSTGARALELCLVLDAIWNERKYPWPLVFASRLGNRTMAYARSMLEWMSPSVVREWEERGTSPFSFKCLKIVSTASEADAILGPKVVLASGPGLEWGVSREVFQNISKSDRNLVILTQCPDCDSLAGQVYEEWKATADSARSLSDERIGFGTRIKFERTLDSLTTVALAGSELELYLTAEQARKNLEEQQNAIELKNKTILDREEFDESESSSSDDNDDDDEEDIAVDADDIELPGALTEVGVMILTQDNEVYDYDVRAARGAKNRMFPHVMKRKRRDAYGEVIRFDDYVRAEEKEEGLLETNGYVENGIGSKRTWTDKDGGYEGPTVDRDENGSMQMDLQHEAADVPSKTIIEKLNVDVQCEVTFVDYNGLADARSIEMIMQQIQPRKLIFISGWIKQAKHLSNAIQQAGGEIGEIYISQSRNAINASMDANAYIVTLDWTLARGLEWHSVKAGEYEVAQIRAKIGGPENDAEANVTEAESQSQAYNLTPLSSRAEECLAITKKDDRLYVGDIRLAELRRRLQNEGIRAEFRGEGVLLCGGLIAVRKVSDRNVVIEGGICKEFYNVRQVVESFLAEVM